MSVVPAGDFGGPAVSYSLTVVVPTYNRCDALEQCMRHLEQQVRKDFEVIIVDDGSTDSTEEWVAGYRKRTPLSVRYFRQQNSGPARARNFAISLAEAPVILLIGDDIFPTPELIARHMQLHEERPEPSVVGLGLTLWSETGQEVTPFMRWLDKDGMQFNYGELLAGVKPDWKHFYTSNLSVKTSLLRQFPFDESFPYAAMEDIEVACRIEAEHGLEMVFLSDAIAYHLHPTSFLQACGRMEKVGESAAYFDELWPGKLPRQQSPLAVKLRKILVRTPQALPVFKAIADKSQTIACPNRLMTFLLSYYFDRGYERRARHAH
ncbi:glycosyltransferase family 2 protein [Silvibacterium acidisoli]|uniref:glycosyltransferase family 2 protein n=1 Tax=Acidobacteriaceae bacterium ZG23-2 TaxID=2883246 RepID=UPI00406C119D